MYSNMQEVGVLLKKSRESKKIKLKEAAKILKIRQRYLEAIESGDFTGVPQEIYVVGYVKSYAKWLGADGNELISTLKQPKQALSTPSLSSAPISPSFSFNIPLPNISFASTTSSYSNDVIVRPGAGVVLLSMLLSIIVYSVWYRGNYTVPTAIFYGADDVQASPVAAADVAPAAEYHFLLLAQDAAVLTIFGKDGKAVATQPMLAGDVFFVSEQEARIEADHPEAVEVYIDDGQNILLGTLGTTATFDDMLEKAKAHEAGAQ